MAGPAVGRLHSGRPGEIKGQPKLVDVLSGASADAGSIPAASIIIPANRDISVATIPTGQVSSLSARRRLEVRGVQVRGDVRSRADVGVAGEHLGELEVAAATKELGDRGMAGLVHRPVSDPGPLEAALPPGVHRSRRAVCAT
jgi:hypothetical protein